MCDSLAPADPLRFEARPGGRPCLGWIAARSGNRFLTETDFLG